MEEDKELETVVQEVRGSNGMSEMMGYGMLAIIFVLALTVFCVLFNGTPRLKEFNSQSLGIEKVQAEAQKSNLDYATTQLKRDVELTMAVVTACTKAGNIPIKIGQNVDCKPAPARAK